jgi:hypothetical protein
MENLLASANAVTNKRKLPRPTGEDVDRYKNINSWSYRRWAWEFLRRNAEFISECERVKNDSDDAKKTVAKQFGLTRFKYYKEAYKGVSGYPKYQTDAIKSWTHLNSEHYKKEKTRKLNPGEVMICFDLNAALEDKHALAKQLQLAERRLEQRLKAYAVQQNVTTNRSQPKAFKFGMYLRLLDALADGKTPVECARMLNPQTSADVDSTEARSQVRDQIDAAKRYAGTRYRSLSLLKGKPGGKSIRLSGH